MRAYKFRAADQLHFALDIIINNRLFCSDWKTLNDPMEGTFSSVRHPAQGRDLQQEVDDIIRQKHQYRVCSLSKTFDNHLLWAHYASGFGGLAVEVDLPEPPGNPAIKEITYRDGFHVVSLENAVDPLETAREILSSKYKAWEYEQEVRVLQREQWFPLSSPVRRVIVGHRMHEAVIEGLKIICQSKGVELCRTGIGDEGIDADAIDAPRRRRRVDGRARQQPRAGV
jgi:hypothetical protein